MGNIPEAFDMHKEIVLRGFPIKHVRPTHRTRIRHVFDSAVEFARAGGYIDITSGGSCCFESGSASAFIEALAADVDPKLITMSSDGHESMPCFDANGNMVGLTVCGTECNLATVQELITKHNVAIPTTLGFITKNVADSHGLKDQGRVTEGAVGNALLFDENRQLTGVFARGRQMMRLSEIIVKGTFER